MQTSEHSTTENSDSEAAILDLEELKQMRAFVAERDRHANLLGQATMRYEQEKAHRMQQIQISQQKEQEYICAILHRKGIDPNKYDVGLDYETGKLIIRGEVK